MKAGIHSNHCEWIAAISFSEVQKSANFSQHVCHCQMRHFLRFISGILPLLDNDSETETGGMERWGGHSANGPRTFRTFRTLSIGYKGKTGKSLKVDAMVKDAAVSLDPFSFSYFTCTAFLSVCCLGQCAVSPTRSNLYVFHVYTVLSCIQITGTYHRVTPTQLKLVCVVITVITLWHPLPSLQPRPQQLKDSIF